MKSEILGIPADAIFGVPSIRILGDMTIDIVNYKGLKSCCPEEIRLNTKIGDLIVGGNGLGIIEINSEGIRIEGKINKIAYV